MDRGALGALNYRMTFPGQQQMAQEDAQVVPMNPQGYLPPAEKDPLAVREKLTSDYYNNYNLLQNVVKDAMAQGLNPFEPDYSQEGGGLAFQTFQRAQAGLMYAANALKNEMSAENQTRPYELSGAARLKPGVEREGLYYSDPNNFMSTKLPQGVEETNQRLAQTTQTPQDQNRANQLLQAEVQKIDQQVAQGIMSKEEGDYYKAQLVPNVYKTPIFSPNSQDKDGQKYENSIAMLRKYTNLKNGVWNTGTFGKTTVDGKVYLTNEDGKGDVLGKHNAGVDKNGTIIYKDKVVDKWLKDPQTGKVFIKYTDSQIPIEEVSNRSGDAITRDFVSNNAKYGTVDKIMEAASARGYLDDKGSSIDERLMPENYQDVQREVDSVGKTSALAVDKAMKSLRKQLRGIKDPLLGNNWVDYELPNGKIAKVAKHRDKNLYYIKNVSELFPSATGEEREDMTNLTEDEIFSFLDDNFNYSSKFLNERSGMSTTQQKALSAFEQQMGRKPTPSEEQKILAKYK